MGNFGKSLRPFTCRKIVPQNTFVEKKWQIWGLCYSSGGSDFSCSPRRKAKTAMALDTLDKPWANLGIDNENEKQSHFFSFSLNIQSSLENPSEKVHSPVIWNQQRTAIRGGAVSSPSDGFPSLSHTGEEPFVFYLQCFSTCHLTSAPGASTFSLDPPRTKFPFPRNRSKHNIFPKFYTARFSG